MSVSHRHHYISRFYLRNFVADKNSPKLFVADFPEHKTFTTSPDNVALENDFHTISISGQEPDAVEKRLAQFEADVAPALGRVISCASLANKADAALVLFFATLLLIKGPSNRNVVNDFANQIMQTMGKIQASDQEQFSAKIRRYIDEGTLPANTDIEEVRQYILSGSYTIGLSTEAHLDMEFKNATALFEEFVMNRHWNVLRAVEGQFITCDRPVVMMWSDPMRTDPVGLGRPNSRMLFALSSNIVLNGGFELEDGRIDINAEEVAKINGHIILNANRQVYGRDGEFSYDLRHNAGIKKGTNLLEDPVARR